MIYLYQEKLENVLIRPEDSDLTDVYINAFEVMGNEIRLPKDFSV